MLYIYSSGKDILYINIHVSSCYIYSPVRLISVNSRRGRHALKMTPPVHVGSYQGYSDNNFLLYHATSKVISGWVPGCHSGHSLRLYSADLLGNQVASTMTLYLSQLQYHYTGFKSTSLQKPETDAQLAMPSVRLGTDKYQFCKSLV